MQQYKSPKGRKNQIIIESHVASKIDLKKIVRQTSLTIFFTFITQSGYEYLGTNVQK